jgi:hypothetical protein
MILDQVQAAAEKLANATHPASSATVEEIDQAANEFYDLLRTLPRSVSRDATEVRLMLLLNKRLLLFHDEMYTDPRERKFLEQDVVSLVTDILILVKYACQVRHDAQTQEQL